MGFKEIFIVLGPSLLKLNKIQLLDELESSELLINISEEGNYEGGLIDHIIGNQGIIVSSDSYSEIQHIQSYVAYLEKNRIKVAFEKGRIKLTLVENYYDLE